MLFCSWSWSNTALITLQTLMTARSCERSGARSERGAERAKYSRSAKRVLIQRPERWFHFAPVPFRYRWQYKAIHWLKQTEHRKRTRWQPKTIYCSLQTEKGFNRQAHAKEATARQFRPHRAVCPRRNWWKMSGIAPPFKFEWAWSNFTGAEWNFRWVASGLWAELSGITLSDGAKEQHPHKWGAEILANHLHSHSLMTATLEESKKSFYEESVQLWTRLY